ncbi:MAG TPA: oligosaccharide flippase family protein [Solirubrobacteraceae bacterium]|jgi:O-antigen/teichoic acid export membrane protein
MRQVIRRFAVLASSSALTQLIAFIALAIAARRVGPANLGSYTVVLALVTFLSLPITVGITNVGLRDVARRPDQVLEVTGEVFVLQLILATAAYVVLIALAPVITPTAAMSRLLPIVALFLFTGTSFEWTLQGLGRMREIAIARIVGQVAYGVLVPVLVVDGFPGILRYSWLMIAGLALKHVLTTVFLIRAAGLPRLRAGHRSIWRRFRVSVPMSYASVMLQVYGQIDQVMLGYLSTSFDAGQYAAAYRIPGAILTFAGSWLSVVFPHSSALAETNREQLRRHAGMLLSVIAMFSLPLVACTPFVAHDLMVAAFGSQFGPASTAFTLLTVTVALALIDGTLSTLLLGLGGDRRYAVLVTATALFNAVVNVPVIALFGRNGAAVVTIVSETLLFAMLALSARLLLGGIVVEWGRLGRAALAVVPAVLALIVVPEGAAIVWVRILLGGAVYGVGTVLFGAVRVTEIRHVFAPRLTRAAPAGR